MGIKVPKAKSQSVVNDPFLVRVIDSGKAEAHPPEAEDQGKS